MRVGVSQAGSSTTDETSASHNLPVQGEPLSAQRFGFYTDPMAAFSTKKKSNMYSRPPGVITHPKVLLFLIIVRSFHHQNGTVEEAVKKIVATLYTGEVPSQYVDVLLSPPYVFLTMVKSSLRPDMLRHKIIGSRKVALSLVK